jgi:hypothetical protein
MMIRGHCECGQVHFEILGEMVDYAHCHCSQCRRLHGAAFATFAGVLRSEFRYTSGENKVATYSSSKIIDRIFCKTCGSNIMAIPHDEPGVYYVSMGAIEGNPPHPPAYHIFVGSKAKWHAICDDLPRFDEYRPESE